jgi:hypothetical protein
MTTSHQDEQRERREYIEDELRKRQQGSTLHQFATADAEFDRGRFTATERATVIGSSETPQYPQLPSGPWSGQNPEPGIEPPLGYEIHAMQPLEPPNGCGTSSFETPTETSSPFVGTGPASADAPSTVLPSSDEQRAGAGPSSSTHTGCNDGAVKDGNAQ